MRLPFRFARRFVASETLDGAIPVVKQLNAKGLHVSLDKLGEYVKDRSVAEEATYEYLRLVQRIKAEREKGGLDSNISIKLSMMGQKIDRAFCVGNLTRLLQAASAADIFVRLDMEGSDLTESTLSIFEEVYPSFPDHVGVVLQAYLHRTAEDVARMCELKARVRICKGAYKEPATIAYQDMDTIREKFVGYMQQLITQARYPGIATHDDKLINATKEFVATNNISRDAFEFQMLYGLRPKTHETLVQEGYHMRVYVPYGTEWLPYFTRRLRERKENVFFVLKAMVKG